MVETYGELDEWLCASPVLVQNTIITNKTQTITTKSVKDDATYKSLSIAKANQNPTKYKLTEKKRFIAREQAKRGRARRKAELLKLIKHNDTLQKQNGKLKKEICILKKELSKLIILCKNKTN